MGADVNFVDIDGNTPLFEAATILYYEEEHLRELLENGANVNFKNDKNITAIALVSKKNYKLDYQNNQNFDLHTLTTYQPLA